VSRGALLVVPFLLVAGCFGRTAGPVGPVVSPTGIVYDPGTPPTETRWSQTAGLYIRSNEPDRALEFALEGIEADPTNPVHHFLAGLGYVRLERYAEAHAAFTEAQRIYPAYELDVEPEREAGWAAAYNAGAEAYASGDVEQAIEAWQGAVTIFDLRPEAHRNLAMLLQDEARFREAGDVYRAAVEGLARRPVTRVLTDEEIEQREATRFAMEGSLAELLLLTDRFAEAEPLLRRQLQADAANTRVQQNLALALGALGKDEEAAELHAALLADGTLEAAELFNLGVALFRASDHAGAARAFGRLTEVRPHPRDARFNYANALFAAEDWRTLTGVGDRLVELDPLNENAALIAARAHLEAGDEARAVQGVRRIEAAPVHVEGIVLRPAPGGISLQGRLTGNRADPGTQVRLRFTFFDERTELGVETVTLIAPPPGETASFEVPFRGQAAGYRYEVLAAEAGEG
jgi:tetratricopeptide (TPR) repeat protein